MASKYDTVYISRSHEIVTMVNDYIYTGSGKVSFPELKDIGERNTYKGYVAFNGRILSGNSAHIIALVRGIQYLIERKYPNLQEKDLVLLMDEAGNAMLTTYHKGQKSEKPNLNNSLEKAYTPVLS
jgi:hypothetical protein